MDEELAATIAGCTAAHRRLETTAASVDDEVVRRPSLLPGWDGRARPDPSRPQRRVPCPHAGRRHRRARRRAVPRGARAAGPRHPGRRGALGLRAARRCRCDGRRAGSGLGADDAEGVAPSRPGPRGGVAVPVAPLPSVARGRGPPRRPGARVQAAPLARRVRRAGAAPGARHRPRPPRRRDAGPGPSVVGRTGGPAGSRVGALAGQAGALPERARSPARRSWRGDRLPLTAPRRCDRLRRRGGAHGRARPRHAGVRRDQDVPRRRRRARVARDVRRRRRRTRPGATTPSTAWPNGAVAESSTRSTSSRCAGWRPSDRSTAPTSRVVARLRASASRSARWPRASEGWTFGRRTH